jgi:hypothetical protein
MNARVPSTMNKLASTPLSDVARGRLTGRLAWREAIVRANLPAPAAGVIREVVRRTRLWRTERADVAMELIAHFQDGLESGASADELVRAFGDPRSAAKLITRAKRRSRGPLWKVANAGAWGFVGLAAVMALVYAWWAVLFFSSSPRIARDYAAELNAPITMIPESDRALPLYQELFRVRADLPKDAPFPPEVIEGRRYDGAYPGDPEWPAAEAYLAQNTRAIELARSAATKPALGNLLNSIDGWDSSASGGPSSGVMKNSLYETVLPHISITRHAARLLAMTAAQAAARGDGARAIGDCIAILRIANHSEENGFLIGQLVRQAIDSLALSTVGWIAAHHPSSLDDAQWRELAHTIAAELSDDETRLRFDVERAGFDDLLQRVYSDDGRGNGRLTREGVEAIMSMDTNRTGFDRAGAAFLGPALSGFGAGRKLVKAEYDALLDAAQLESDKPLREQNPAAFERRFDERVGGAVNGVRYIMVRLMTPAFSRTADGPERTRQHRDAVLTAIALVLHHRRTGAYPASLDEVVPALLPALPMDRYSGQPMKYMLRDGAPVLYSVGVNKIDDGGVPGGDRTRRNPDGSETIPDGDWILWPAK